jgi:hypothetical protein
MENFPSKSFISFVVLLIVCDKDRIVSRFLECQLGVSEFSPLGYKHFLPSAREPNSTVAQCIALVPIMYEKARKRVPP